MRRYAFAVILGVVGCAVLVMLGLWQLDRLTVKTAAIAEINARIGAAPIPVPIQPNPETDQYLPVIATGALSDFIRVYTSREDIGAGYRIIQVLSFEGRRVLVDRGFLPIEADSGAAEPVVVTVTGNLHWPDENNSWIPEPDIEGNRWFARDVARMATHLGTEPVMIVARRLDPDGFVARPIPVSAAEIRNNHLEYVVTWFSLALVWAGMTAYLLWRIKRRTA